MKPFSKNTDIERLIKFAAVLALIILINQLIIQKYGYTWIFFFDVLLFPIIFRLIVSIIDKVKKSPS
jgi:hypothetical protein